MMNSTFLKTGKRFFAAIVLVFFVSVSFGQVAVTVTGSANTTPPLAAGYSSLANAITALNGITAISGQVKLTCDAGSETAPAGGYSITALPTGISSSNNIIIEGTATTTITAYTPQSTAAYNDAIFKLIGADFITIQNFTMQENASNVGTTPASNTMTEWGVALLYASTTNGSQNNTIQNNII